MAGRLSLRTGLIWTETAWRPEEAVEPAWRHVVTHQTLALTVLEGPEAQADMRLPLVLAVLARENWSPAAGTSLLLPPAPERAGPGHPAALAGFLGRRLAERFSLALESETGDGPPDRRAGSALNRPRPYRLAELWAAARRAAEQRGLDPERNILAAALLDEGVSMALFEEGSLRAALDEDEGPPGPGAWGALPAWDGAPRPVWGRLDGWAARLGAEALLPSFWNRPEAASPRARLVLDLLRHLALMIPLAAAPPALLALTGRFAVEALIEDLERISARFQTPISVIV